jgi:hypothetical protein
MTIMMCTGSVVRVVCFGLFLYGTGCASYSLYTVCTDTCTGCVVWARVRVLVMFACRCMCAYVNDAMTQQHICDAAALHMCIVFEISLVALIQSNTGGTLRCFGCVNISHG